jgi:hypothetical protein
LHRDEGGVLVRPGGDSTTAEGGGAVRSISAISTSINTSINTSTGIWVRCEIVHVLFTEASISCLNLWRRPAASRVQRNR